MWLRFLNRERQIEERREREGLHRKKVALKAVFSPLETP
jgi:hypothetical protein